MERARNSMCLGMNEDQLKPRERCASTLTEILKEDKDVEEEPLVSPAMAAAAAIEGHLSDVRSLIIK